MTTLTFASLASERVPVDYNSRDHRGLVRATLDECPAGITGGDAVIVYDPSDESRAFAWVKEIDFERGLAFMFVDWTTVEEDDNVDNGADQGPTVRGAGPWGGMPPAPTFSATVAVADVHLLLAGVDRREPRGHAPAVHALRCGDGS